MATVQERFEAKVDRSGEHHLWTGSTDAGGVPQIRVDGRLTTARRVAWELTKGPLHPRQRVAACPADPGCVRIEHLQLSGRPASVISSDSVPNPIATRSRRTRGTGSLVEQSPGVWRIASTGLHGRRVQIVHGSRGIADASLAVLMVQTAAPSLTMSTLITGYLIHLRVSGYADGTIRRYEQLWRTWLAPQLAGRTVQNIDRAIVSERLHAMTCAGQSDQSLRQASSLVRGALDWAASHDETVANHRSRRGPYRHVGKGL